MLPHQLTVAFSSLLLFAAPALSQNLLASAPACAQACTPLAGNAGACVPPAVPVSNLAGYKACFCPAAVPPVVAAGSTYCTDWCTTPAEQTQLVNWINNFCAEPSTSTSSVIPTSAPTVGPTHTPGTHAPHHHHKATGYVPSHGHTHYHPQPKGTWWQQHGRWIIMVIVLIIGFSIITVLGILYKRRYDRRHNTASAPAANESWGPNTTQFRSSSIYEADETAQLSTIQEKRNSFRSMQERRHMGGR